jgi:putative ABC transport system permease protein
MVSIDEEFFETLKVEFLAGRNFDPMSTTDGEVVILNEAAVHLLGYNDAAKILHQRLHDELNDRDAEIVGVIKNYHQRSLNNFHEPIIFVPNWVPENSLGGTKF